MKITSHGVLFHYYLFSCKSCVGGHGTLYLALGTFGTFYLSDIRQLLIVAFRLLVLVVLVVLVLLN